MDPSINRLLCMQKLIHILNSILVAPDFWYVKEANGKEAGGGKAF